MNEGQKKTLLAVDDTPENLDVLRGILVPEYVVKVAPSGKVALKIAETQHPDLILLDIMMPEMDGYEVCERLKSNPATRGIPVIFVSALSEVGDESRGFDVGAVDYITKPVSPPIVRRRVKNQLSLVRTEELDALARAAIRMLGEAGHFNDTDTGRHIWRMAAFSRAIAEAAGWHPKQAEMLELAAPMHDTGKIGIPHSILKASRQLESEEWQVMQQHCQIGHDILSMSDNPVLKLAAEVALCHHEHWDGSGYPQGLKGDAIPEAARIVSLADVFDALTMKRPYKEAWPTEQAIAEIQSLSGVQFDPVIVDHFLRVKERIIAIKARWDREDPEPH